LDELVFNLGQIYYGQEPIFIQKAFKANLKDRDIIANYNKKIVRMLEDISFIPQIEFVGTFEFWD